MNSSTFSLKKLAITHIPEFAAISNTENLAFSRMGGFSRKVFKISSPTFSVILKEVQDENKDTLFNHYEPKIEEIRIAANFGPKFYYEDNEISIEECLDARTLTYSDTIQQNTRILVLEELVKFSKMETNGHLLNPRNKTLYSDVIERGLANELLESQEIYRERNPNCDLLDKILVLVDKEASSEYLKNIVARFENPSQPGYENILCHNDFYFMNLMQDNDQEEKFHLIDYEFSSFNPMFWDLAHLCLENTFRFNEETGKFDLKFEDYVSPEDLKELVTAFLMRWKLYGNAEQQLPKGMAFVENLRAGEYSGVLTDEEIQGGVAAFSDATLLMNVFWIKWCVWRLRDKNIDWPILDYVGVRIEAQEKLKELFLGSE